MISAIALLLLAAPADPVRPSPEVVASYRKIVADSGRDAASQVKLALWCETHGLNAERLEHLARAVMLDPTNAAARGLLGFVSDSGRWRRPEDLAAKAGADAKQAALLSEYAERRGKAPKTADGHWRMALWCEENGLEDEAATHLTACVRLDPGRTAAWKRLGCKKVNGRWMSPDQIAARKAESQAQADADKRYRPMLAAWKSAVKGRDEAKRFDAERGLGTLKDPRAARSVWQVFVVGAESNADLNRAVQILGQIDSPLATRQLAMIAMEANDAAVRAAATETLRRRDPRDFLGPMIAMLQEELKWEVRPVNGPGSAGVLFVEGKQFRRTRYYAPPALDFNYVDTGEPWGVDADGFAVLRVPGENVSETINKGKVATLSGAEARRGLKAGDPRAAAFNAAAKPGNGKPGSDIADPIFKPGWGSGAWLRDGDFQVNVAETQTITRSTETTIPIGRILHEYRKSAAAAEEQLEQDTAAVKRQNDAIRSRNRRLTDLMNDATGQSLPPDGAAWKSWWADQRGYAYEEPPTAPKVEVVENVPLAYLPAPVPGATTRVGPVVSTTSNFTVGAQLTDQGVQRAQQAGLYADCFAAGTPVRTKQGMRPIESLEVGDSVLAQDMATGSLAYKPVLAVFKFRPAEALKVTIGGETLITTRVHRFWKVGQGWVMARDLKPGDAIRRLGGTAKVEAVQPDGIRQVFNLEVADFADYFVGQTAILAGDNSLQEARVTPFDAP